MLQIKNLNLKIGKQSILKEISWHFQAGKIYALQGANGSGKSSLVKVITGQKEYQNIEGQLLWQDQTWKNLDENSSLYKSLLEIKLKSDDQSLDLNLMPADLRFHLGIMSSWQEIPEIPGLNLATFLKTVIHNQANLNGQIKPTTKLILNNIKNLQKNLNLDTNFYKRELNYGFSGGEKRKSELMQIFLFQPKFLILDEIDSGLDQESKATASKLLLAYLDNNPQTCLLLISHQPDFLRSFPIYQTLILDQGKLRKEGY